MTQLLTGIGDVRYFALEAEADELERRTKSICGTAALQVGAIMASCCAVCVADVRGQPFRTAPLGKGDALVRVCANCDVVQPDEPRLRRQWRDPEASPRSQLVRAHRDRLKLEGICVNGRRHGLAVEGQTLCASCKAREDRRRETRKANTP